MTDYISREAAIAYIREQSEELQKAFEELGGESGIYADAYNDLAEDFHRIPAADVEPVRHGRWECVYDDNTGETDITCSHETVWYQHMGILRAGAEPSWGYRNAFGMPRYYR